MNFQSELSKPNNFKPKTNHISIFKSVSVSIKFDDIEDNQFSKCQRYISPEFLWCTISPCSVHVPGGVPDDVPDLHHVRGADWQATVQVPQVPARQRQEKEGGQEYVLSYHPGDRRTQVSNKMGHIYFYHMFLCLWSEISLFHELIYDIAPGSFLIGLKVDVCLWRHR